MNKDTFNGLCIILWPAGLGWVYMFHNIWKIFFRLAGLASDDAGGPHEDDDNDDDDGCRPENGDKDKDDIDEDDDDNDDEDDDDNHDEEDDDDNNEEDEDDDGGCHGPAQQLTLPPVIESWKVSCLCISRRTVLWLILYKLIVQV